MKSKFLLFLSVLLLSSQLYAADFAIEDVTLDTTGHQVYASCMLNYELHEKVETALLNGIEMMFNLELQVKEKKKYWPDVLINSVYRNFTIKYHALSEQFVVLELDKQIERSFPDLYSAFYDQEHVEGIKLIAAQQLDNARQYYVRARIKLVSEELPLPLRVKSYFSKQWRPSSGWSVWPM